MYKKLIVFALSLFVFLICNTTNVSAEKSVALLETELNAAKKKLGGDYVQIGQLVTGGLAKGQTKKIKHTLRKNTCYQMLAVGSETVTDLDMRLFGKFKLLAKDQGETTSPVIKFCTKKDVVSEIRVQIFKGKGQFAYGLFAKGENLTNLLPQTEQAALLALKKREEKLEPGLIKIGNAFTGELETRTAVQKDILLEKPACYKFIAAGIEGVRDMTLALYVDGKEVASDRISGQSPSVSWCSAKFKTKIQVRLAMYSGAGAYAWVMYQEPKTSVVKSNKIIGGSKTDFIANRLRQLHTQYGNGRTPITSVLRGNLAINTEQVFDVKLKGGQCYTFIGVGSPSIKDMDIIFLDSRGRELQSDKSKNSYPVINTNPCPSFSGKYKIKIKIIRGFGQFGVQVFSN